MISYVDIGLAAFLRSELDEKFAIVMAPPEVSKQALARHDGNGSRGLPGLTFWRSSVMPGPMFTMAQAGNPGVPQGASGSDYIFTRQIDRKVLYTIKAWSQHSSDRDAMESAFAFMGVYKEITATIKDSEEDEFSVKFPIFTEPVIYGQETNQETGETMWWSFTTTIETEAPWVKGAIVPRIEEIIVNYHEYTTGSLIDDAILETVTISVDGENIEVTGSP